MKFCGSHTVPPPTPPAKHQHWPPGTWGRREVEAYPPPPPAFRCPPLPTSLCVPVWPCPARLHCMGVWLGWPSPALQSSCAPQESRGCVWLLPPPLAPSPGPDLGWVLRKGRGEWGGMKEGIAWSLRKE